MSPGRRCGSTSVQSRRSGAWRRAVSRWSTSQARTGRQIYPNSKSGRRPRYPTPHHTPAIRNLVGPPFLGGMEIELVVGAANHKRCILNTK